MNFSPPTLSSRPRVPMNDFHTSYSKCMLYMCAINACLLAIDLVLIVATNLDKKR